VKPLPLAAAVSLCAALAFTGCAKKTDQSTGASTATPATTSPVVTLTGGYIVIPVYPGATSRKDDEYVRNRYGPSAVVKLYSTKDDPGRVADWYVAHLPSSWLTSVYRNHGKTEGNFQEKRKDGGLQSVIVESQHLGTTLIEIATEHGK
jgi:hypothetical protein